jgi:hypothetical protein
VPSATSMLGASQTRSRLGASYASAISPPVARRAAPS